MRRLAWRIRRFSKKRTCRSRLTTAARFSSNSSFGVAFVIPEKDSLGDAQGATFGGPQEGNSWFGKKAKKLHIVLKSEILNYELKRQFMQDLTLLIPVTNIFEIFYIEINDRIFRFENLKIFELRAMEEKVVFESQSDRIKPSKTNQKRTRATWACPTCTRRTGSFTRRNWNL